MLARFWLLLAIITAFWGKLVFLARKIVSAYCISNQCLDYERDRLMAIAESAVTSIMLAFLLYLTCLVLSSPE